MPGTFGQVQDRLEGLGPVSGLGVRLGIGALCGLLRAGGVKIPMTAAPVVPGLGAMAVSDGAMTSVGVTDPPGLERSQRRTGRLVAPGLRPRSPGLRCTA